MKKVISFLALACFVAPVLAAETFQGSAVAQGDIEANCTDIGYPSEAIAERSADRAAEAFCVTVGAMKPFRLSAYTYSYSGCLREGRGFAVHTAEYTYAAAEYRCKKEFETSSQWHQFP